MKPNKPVGFAALLEKMPRRFKAQAERVEERARLRREALAKRFELEFLCAVEVKDSGWEEWQDTVAQFNARSGEDHGTA
ncbi:hypothetical protein ASC95_08440 [Pelomonas sp. Root1217]|uniref:hypothetical protein n=1 Tax=Pelomonas sp. Root1217 TaxID=1736430 RepID=UPI00070B0D70|nr:hypothetical protein [Pelomonas sp. Root1217]KQV52823.1 hypothetical protein ASC95_08440 [Pelomonas sp. Root1217]